MLECFVPKDFNAEHLALIETANTIIDEFQAGGFTLTLRQLYYQFVARGFIENRVQEYKRLGSIISDARLAGVIDWAAFEDRRRPFETISTWRDPADIIESAHQSYKEDLWASQVFRPEVWIEKDAQIAPVCRRWRLPSMVCHGYVSQTALYDVGRRASEYANSGQTLVMLHLGDHDPSGFDMSRDNAKRLELFSGRCGAKLVRLALNMDQIERYRPPPNPAKETDSRYSGYRDQFGDESWELDALSPQIIDGLIDSYIRSECVDVRRWNAAAKREKKSKRLLNLAAERWDDVAALLEE